MAEKKYNVPNVLPILPVRDTVLFPGAVLGPTNRGNEDRTSGPSDGFHRGGLAVAFNAVAPGINRNRQRAQEAGNADPRTVEGTRGSGAALENPRASAGTGEPKPARVLAA